MIRTTLKYTRKTCEVFVLYIRVRTVELRRPSTKSTCLSYWLCFLVIGARQTRQPRASQRMLHAHLRPALSYRFIFLFSLLFIYPRIRYQTKDFEQEIKVTRILFIIESLNQRFYHYLCYFFYTSVPKHFVTRVWSPISRHEPRTDNLPFTILHGADFPPVSLPEFFSTVSRYHKQLEQFLQFRRQLT